MKLLKLIYTTAVLLLLLNTGHSFGAVQSSETYSLESNVLSSGGDISSSASYDAETTTGQSSAIGESSSETYFHYTGFWYSIGTGSVDTDNDGMPDSFEIQYGLNPNDPNDASAHNDGDGLTNLEEYLAGTNPLLTDTDGDSLADNIDTCPTTLPVKNGALYYASIQSAYAAANEGDIIQSHMETLTGDINLNLAISVDIKGGYSCSYSAQNGDTIIIGNMTISSGAASMEKLVLQ